MATVMRKVGIKSLTIGDIVIELGEAPIKPTKRNLVPADQKPEVSEPSTDDLLFWSSTPLAEAPSEGEA